jgi:acetyl esterase/lipase
MPSADAPLPNVTLPLSHAAGDFGILRAYLPPVPFRAQPPVAVIIVPGGSYRPGPFGWCKTAEGSDVARWLASELGITALVLHYRSAHAHRL